MMRVAIVLPIYVLFRFKGNLKLRWVFNTCFAPFSYVRNKKTNEIWFYELLARPMSSFLEGPRPFAPIVFLDPSLSKNYEPCAHDAHKTFLFIAKILLAVLALNFQLCALLAGLLSLYTSHGTSSCALVVAR